MNIPEPSLERARQTAALLRTPGEKRDGWWLRQFYSAVVDAAIVQTDPPIVTGPDGFPYLAATLPGEGETHEGLTVNSVGRLLDQAMQDGLGIVINPQKAQPDWVFTYGHIFSYKAYQSFMVEAPPVGEAGVEKIGDAGRQVMIASPNEEFLPTVARSAIKRYLQAQGISEPGVLLMVDPSHGPTPALVFNVFPENFPAIEQFQTFLQRLTWFLPPHYIITGVSRSDDMLKQFQAL